MAQVMFMMSKFAALKSLASGPARRAARASAQGACKTRSIEFRDKGGQENRRCETY